MTVVTGEALKIARQIYGFETQEALADAMGVKIGTVQRHESSLELSTKIIGDYQIKLGFDLINIASMIRQHRTALLLKAGTQRI